MDTLPVINRTYEVYKDIIELNDHLEKRWRYTLGASLENSVLDLLEQLVMAKNAPKPLKAVYLIKAMARLEVSVLKLRLVLEKGLANETQIFQVQALLAEIGKMLGGWLRSVQSL